MNGFIMNSLQSKNLLSIPIVLYDKSQL
jgi:hypothetical protein